MHWGSWNYSTWSLWQKLYVGSSMDCMLKGSTWDFPVLPSAYTGLCCFALGNPQPQQKGNCSSIFKSIYSKEASGSRPEHPAVASSGRSSAGTTRGSHWVGSKGSGCHGQRGMDVQLNSPWRVVKSLMVAARKRHQGRAVGLETPETSSIPLLMMMPLTSAECGAVWHAHGGTQQAEGGDTLTCILSLKWKTSLGPPPPNLRSISLLQSRDKAHLQSNIN